MITSTIRRAARSPAASYSGSTPTNHPIAATRGLLSSRCHQRRLSSSKPPTPPNDRSSTIPSSVKSVNPAESKTDSSQPETEESQPKTSPTKTKNEKGATTELKQGKRKNSGEVIPSGRSLNIPSVPNTNHLRTHDVFVAAFFAFHRPISITSSVPPHQSEESFSTLFSPKPRSKAKSQSQVTDVVSTVSSAIQGLEYAIQQQSPQESPNQENRKSARRREANELLDSMTQSSTNHPDSEKVHHLDGQPGGQSIEGQAKLPAEYVSQQLYHYQPPPPPVPMPDITFDAGLDEISDPQQPPRDEETAIRKELREEQQDRSGEEEEAVYQSLVTMRQRVSKDGMKFFTAHASPLVRVQSGQQRRVTRRPKEQGHTTASSPNSSSESALNLSTPYLRRRNQNILLLEQSRAPSMYAISTRRRRKLKMNKHKHKKLLRKTRNLRRKLEKL
ncbi:MAG: hypothetical protein Q9227_006699 [Pyrenula ochraceoflavens]